MVEPCKSRSAWPDAEPALFYREVLGEPVRLHLAEFVFDEAARFINVLPEYEGSGSTVSTLSIFKGHLVSWTARPRDLSTSHTVIIQL